MAKPSYLPDEVTTYWDPDEGRVVHPAGTALQKQHSKMTGTQTISTTWGFTKLTALDVTITPISSTSHFLLEAHINHGSDYYSSGFRLYKNDSVISALLGNTSGNRTSVSFGHTEYDGNSGYEDYNMYMSTCNLMHEESGTIGTPITYSIYASPYSSSHPLTINYARENDNSNSRIRTVSSFTVTEIEASGSEPEAPIDNTPPSLP